SPPDGERKLAAHDGASDKLGRAKIVAPLCNVQRCIRRRSVGHCRRMSEPGAAPAPRWLLAVVAAATVVMLVVGWGSRLQWGLWLDETFVAWQAEAGWAIALDKLGDPAQSVLFGYIEALF